MNINGGAKGQQELQQYCTAVEILVAAFPNSVAWR
jgi:hypothetical protein